ncbi:28S ribosomal protein S34, mitochondrial-like [Paramacrobiotus metropolitanus]|uniref:28S ribosomal protein S34, mitochondrial-like n=1 Tax=Paramacrobiotus metropolitanus TaxID=2943436 RepID=UPI00244576A4|nr:28S ribosomal protein S34, mitochondrial-like [Paramacrobiotus metropolitanus]
MPVRYVGPNSVLNGKFLFEILRNLKNFGVGRMVVRSSYERYPEPCYYIVREVKPAMDPEGKNGEMMADVVFRGRDLGLQKAQYCDRPDWRLIPKEDEEAYRKYVKPTVADLPPKAVVPATMPLPPLLKMMHIDEKRRSGKPVGELSVPLLIFRDAVRVPIQEGVEVPLGSAEVTTNQRPNSVLPQSIAHRLHLSSLKKTKK